MERPDILWFGSRKGRADDAAFSTRDLDRVVVHETELTTARLSAARGLVLSFGDGKVSPIRKFAEKNAQAALNHGLAIYVLATEEEVLLHACRELDKIGIAPYTPRVGDATSVPDHLIAQHMLRWDAGRAPSSTMKIDQVEGTLDLSPEDDILLRRAFSDCDQIRIAELGGGRTADTFMVEARFAGASTLVGPRPLPFFVKLGQREKIADEVSKYQRYATQFIPFHLRPNLDLSRCLSGQTRGILVGDFVERAEPFWDVACKGEAHAAVHSLFDLTLAGWRAQGFQRDFGKRPGSVAGALGTRIFDCNKVKEQHHATALEHGLSRSPGELWEALMEIDQCSYRAPMHGDLHPGNVFVRGNDAILIDLASIQDGPLSGDLACLEVALLFETRKDDEKLEPEAWRKAVDAFYAPEHFHQLPPPAFNTDSWSARLNCARQVRMVALPTQACPTEYMSAVAVYLLRRSMHHPDNDTDALRRGYALVVADRLVSELKKDPS